MEDINKKELLNRNELFASYASRSSVVWVQGSTSSSVDELLIAATGSSVGVEHGRALPGVSCVRFSGSSWLMSSLHVHVLVLINSAVSLWLVVHIRSVPYCCRLTSLSVWLDFEDTNTYTFSFRA